MDPSIWSALVAAAAALAGVVIGRATTRSESRIAREDEYRREARMSAGAVIAATRIHDAARNDLLHRVDVSTGTFGLRDTDAGARFSEYGTSWIALNGRIEDFLLLVSDYPLRHAALAFQQSARRLHSRMYGLVYQHYDTMTEGASLRSLVMEEQKVSDTFAERFRETSRERLSHLIVEEREQSTPPSPIRGWMQQQKLSIRVRWDEFRREHTPRALWIVLGALGGIVLLLVMLSLLGVPVVVGD